MSGLDGFAEISERNVSLAPHTGLRVGGPAEYLLRPRSRDELALLVKTCTSQRIPVRVLGGGCNVLVRDEGVRGVVVRLNEPAFTELSVSGPCVKAGGGAPLADLIAFASRHGLGGLEVLVGIPGTVGGAVRGNAGDRTGEIGQFVRSVEVMNENGETDVQDRDELRFGPRWSNIDDLVILNVEFELEPDDPESIVKRMRKSWIGRKATEPPTVLAHARLFRDPRGREAAALIEQAELAKVRVGGAELSSRDANSVVVQSGARAQDVLDLIHQVKDGVDEKFGVELELDLVIW
jgi:UDP-N-acetylmuramate dehydrogenase